MFYLLLNYAQSAVQVRGMEICCWVEVRSVILLKIIHQQNFGKKKLLLLVYLTLLSQGKKKIKSLESSFKVDYTFAEGILNSGKQNEDQSFYQNFQNWWTHKNRCYVWKSLLPCSLQSIHITFSDPMWDPQKRLKSYTQDFKTTISFCLNNKMLQQPSAFSDWSEPDQSLGHAHNTHHALLTILSIEQTCC